MDENKKKMLIMGGVMAGVLVAGIGGTVVIMSGKEEPTGKPGYSTSTPTLQDVAAQPGEVSIEPFAIGLSRTPTGEIQGVATITALFKDFTPGNIQITGDQRLTWKSDCLATGQALKAGTPCAVTITFNPKGPAPAGTPAQVTAAGGIPGVFTGAPPAAEPTPSQDAEFVLSGNTVTPGGSVLPLEKRAKIMMGDPNAPTGAPVAPGTGAIVPAGVGAPGGVPGGAPAPAGIDPYGPVAAGGNVPITSSNLPAAPSLPASDPTSVGGAAGGVGGSAQPVPRVLSPREQFILARRQAVLSQIPPRPQMQPERPQGTWADLKVPTATSSYQQDMSRVVTMDRVITAVLIRPYDSRSSQQVVAQVDRNVYGAHGRNVLIPRGSQIIGTANGGGERVAIQWKQIIRPDGARFMFDASAADAMGQAGVPGRTNQRLLKRYGAILLGTVFKAGVARVSGAAELPSGSEYGQPARNNGAIVSDLVRQDLEKIMADIVQRNSAVQPIITVPAGTRITVVPTMDLQMRPMQARVEEVRSYPRRMNGGAPAPSMPDGEEGGDVTQPRNARRNAESPLPSEDVPATGNTPPWDSN